MTRPDGGATWSAAGEGERLWFLGTLATIRVPGEAVGDRYARSVPAAEQMLPPTGTPRPSPEELDAIFRTHGQVDLGPPLA